MMLLMPLKLSARSQLASKLHRRQEEHKPLGSNSRGFVLLSAIIKIEKGGEKDGGETIGRSGFD